MCRDAYYHDYDDVDDDAAVAADADDDDVHRDADDDIFADRYSPILWMKNPSVCLSTTG